MWITNPTDLNHRCFGAAVAHHRHGVCKIEPAEEVYTTHVHLQVPLHRAKMVRGGRERQVPGLQGRHDGTHTRKMHHLRCGQASA